MKIKLLLLIALIVFNKEGIFTSLGGYTFPNTVGIWSSGTANVVCSSGVPNPSSIKPKGNQSLSVPNNDTSYSNCVVLIQHADSLHDAQQDQKAYDAYRAYIESCAYLSNSWTTFSDVGGTNSARSGDSHRF